LLINSITLTGAGYTLDTASGIFTSILLSHPLAMTAKGGGTNTIEIPISLDNPGGSNVISADTDNTLMITSQISGSQSTNGLTKGGSGTVVLTGANTYNGPTLVASGILDIQNGQALGTSLAGTTVGTGATLQLDGGISVDQPLALNPRSNNNTTQLALEGINGANLVTGPIFLGNAQVLIGVDAGQLTLAGTLSGAGGVTKVGGGQLVLATANTFQSETDIIDGALEIQNGDALGKSDSPVVVPVGAALQLDGGITLDRPVTLHGNGVLGGGALESLSGDNAVSATVTLDTLSPQSQDIDAIGVDDGTLTLDVGLKGGGGLVKVGVGQLTLPAAGSYAGTTTVNDGVLEIQNSMALGTNTSAVVVTNKGALHLEGGITLAVPLTIAGSGVGGSGSLESLSGTNAVTGPIVLTDLLVTIGVDADTLTLSGDLTGSGSLTKVRPGTLLLTGPQADDYGGTTDIVDGLAVLAKPAGVVSIPRALSIEGSVRLAASGQISVLAPVTVSGLLDLNGQTQTVASLTLLGGSVTTGSSTLTLDGDVMVSQGPIVGSPSTASVSGQLDLNNQTRAITVADGQELIVTAMVSGGSGAGLLKAGAGKLVLASTNSYSGPTEISAGLLDIQNGQPLGTSPLGTTVDAGATLQMEGGISLGQPLNLSGSGVGGVGALDSTSGLNTVTGLVTLATSDATVSVDADTLTLSGCLTGSDGLQKVGLGTLSLPVANAYTGATIVAAGILDLQNGQALGTSLAGATVDTGAALRLEGGISLGQPLTLAGSGVGGAGALESTSGANSVTALVTLTTADATIGVDADTLTLSGGLTGSGGLTKVGAGTLILTVAGTYAGPTIIRAGTLDVRDGGALGTSPSGTTIASGATLQLQGGIQFNQPLTLSGNGVAGAGALESISGLNSVSGAVTLAAAGATIGVDADVLTLTAALSGGGLTKVGSGTLVLAAAGTNFGVTDLAAGILNIQSGQALGTSATSAVVAAGATLQLEGGITLNQTLTLYGKGVGGVGALESVDGTNFVNGTVTLATPDATIGVDADQLTLGDGLAGSGGLTKTGSATLVLPVGSTYTGTTTVSAGVLSIQSGQALGIDLAGIVVASGATLQLQGAFGLVHALTLSGSGVNGAGALESVTGANVINSVVTLATADATIGVDAGTLTLTAGLTGSGGLTKAGPGSLVLTAASSYSGPTSINTGVLSLQNAQALGTSSAAAVASGATLQLVGGVQLGQPLTLAGSGAGGVGALDSVSGANFVTAPVTLAVIGATLGADADTLFLSGGLLGTGGLTKIGGGTVVVAGSGTQSGPVTVVTGILDLQDSQALGASSAAVVVTAGASLRLEAGINLDRPLTLTGSGVKGAGGLESVRGVNAVTGAVTLASSDATVGVDADSLTLSGGLLGIGGLTKGGPGTLVLSGSTADSYTGPTEVAAGLVVLTKSAGVLAVPGSLAVEGAVRLDSPGQLAASVTLTLSGQLDLNGQAQTVAALTLAGGSVTTGTGTLTLGSDVTVLAGTAPATIAGQLDLGNRTRKLTLAGSAAQPGLVISATISGAPGAGLIKAGPGTLVLAAANTVSGPISVSAGVLDVQNSLALGTSANGVIVVAGAALRLEGNISLGQPLTLSGTGVGDTGVLESASGVNAVTTLVTLATADATIGVDADSLTLSGGLAGSGGLTKIGSGSLVLTAAGTHSGPTLVSAGTLELANGQALGTSTVGVVVTSGATLQLSGGVRFDQALILSIRPGSERQRCFGQ
jgi:autotransporter-associated beta strand protein